MVRKAVSIGAVTLLLTGFVIGYLAARNNIQPMHSAVADQPNQQDQTPSFPSPINPNPNRDAYFPQTEKLGADEMRIISLGTGAAERLSALQIPYNYLNKVFLGHLHADHMGDLPALWVGGTINNRTILRVHDLLEAFQK